MNQEGFGVFRKGVQENLEFVGDPEIILVCTRDEIARAGQDCLFKILARPQGFGISKNLQSHNIGLSPLLWQG